MDYQLASTIARAFASLIAMDMLGGYGYPAVALYMTETTLITIVAIHLVTETYKKDIARRSSEEERPTTEGQTVSGKAAQSTGRQTPIDIVRKPPKPSALEHRLDEVEPCVAPEHLVPDKEGRRPEGASLMFLQMWPTWS